MARPDDIFDLIIPDKKSELTFVLGYLTAWNSTTYENTVTVNGAELTDLPVIHTAEPPEFATDIVVAILRVRSKYYIIGRITTP